MSELQQKYRQRLITLSGEHNPRPEAQFRLESAGIELHGEEATGGTVGPNNMDIQVIFKIVINIIHDRKHVRPPLTGVLSTGQHVLRYVA